MSSLVLEKLQDLKFEDEREEEEALSFSDLPLTKFIQSSGAEEEKEGKDGTKGDDFDFDFDFGFEMCSADEVISGGQLLPFRHSVSSETGVRNSNSRTYSRSGSMDRSGLYSRSGGSSRSSSVRSQYSSTSSTSTSSNNTSTSVKTVPRPKSRGRNNYFHSHPSPKPQIWASGARGPTINYPTPTSKKTTMWDVLRLGLVRGPEIELQDLKQRHRLSNSSKTTFIIPRINSSGSSSNDSNNDNNNNKGRINDFVVGLQNKKSGGFFKSCKCSVLAIEPIHTSREFSPKNNNKFMTQNYYQVMKEDNELAQKKGTLQQQEKQKREQIGQGKKVVSHHHRTFEWLRDLSHVNVLNS